MPSAVMQTNLLKHTFLSTYKHSNIPTLIHLGRHLKRLHSLRLNSIEGVGAQSVKGIPFSREKLKTKKEDKLGGSTLTIS